MVLDRMRAAAEELRDAGYPVDAPVPAADAAQAHLLRAVRWWRESRAGGAMSQRHRACAVDVARGQLRLWTMAGGRPEACPASPGAVRLARVQLTAAVAARCAGLRTELVREAAGLSLIGAAAFTGRVQEAVARAAADVDEQVSRRIAALGLPAGPHGRWPAGDRLPPRRGCHLEHRLSALVGVGFGAGGAATLDRAAAVLLPDFAAAGAIGSAVFGLVLMAGVVLARRLLAERAAAERWVLEAVANLRLAMEELVLVRVLAAESEVSGQSGLPVRDTPD